MTREQKREHAEVLAAEGLTNRRIGEHMRLSVSQVWQLRNPERYAKSLRKSNAQRAAAKRGWERDPANKVKCPRCGGPTGHTPGQRPVQRCAKCKQEEVDALREAILAGYRARKPAGQIAAETGRPVTTIRVEACRMRKRGVDVPLNPWWEQAA